MKLRSTVRRLLSVGLLALGVISGCGAPSADTGPAEEPNRGPGVPAGGPPIESKGGSKSDAGKAAAPTKSAAAK